MVSQVLSLEGYGFLGTISVLIIYFVLGAASTFCAYFTDKYNYKLCLFVTSLGSFYILTLNTIYYFYNVTK